MFLLMIGFELPGPMLDKPPSGSGIEEKRVTEGDTAVVEFVFSYRKELIPYLICVGTCTDNNNCSVYSSSPVANCILPKKNGHLNITAAVSYAPKDCNYKIRINVTIHSIKITDNETIVSLYYGRSSNEDRKIAQYELIVERPLPGIDIKKQVIAIAASCSVLLLLAVLIVGLAFCVIICKWKRSTHIRPLENYAPLEDSYTREGTIVPVRSGPEGKIVEQKGIKS